MLRGLLYFLLLVPPMAFAGDLLSPNDIINPIGDETLGYLQVNLPKEPDAAKTQIVPVTITANGSSVTPGQASRVREDKYLLILESVNKKFRMSSPDVAVTRKQTTTVELGALNVNWDQAPLQVQVGPRPQISIESPVAGNAFALDFAQRWNEKFPTGMSYLPMFPQEYTVKYFGFPILGESTFRLAPGEVKTEILQPPDKRATVQVIAPDSNFPDALAGGPGCGHRMHVVQRKGPVLPLRFRSPFRVARVAARTSDQSGLTALVTFTSQPIQDESISFFPTTDGKTDLFYELVVNNTWMPLQMKPGQTLNVSLRRIDVNDVLVTRENGTTYLSNGQYTINTQTIDAKGVAQWTPVEVPIASKCNATDADSYLTFPTKTGVTVLPGLYQVNISYPTEEGTKKIEQTIDLR